MSQARSRRSQPGSARLDSGDPRVADARQRGLVPRGSTTTSPHARREVERFLREQPVQQIPRRYDPQRTPGLIALPLLGYRVIRRLDV